MVETSTSPTSPSHFLLCNPAFGKTFNGHVQVKQPASIIYKIHVQIRSYIDEPFCNSPELFNRIHYYKGWLSKTLANEKIHHYHGRTASSGISIVMGGPTDEIEKYTTRPHEAARNEQQEVETLIDRAGLTV
ncbi:hypothetical protein M7I_4107 [Glarea lozoyensis 74030]|uniref:Uncharacterized protein n=1 Tax=Glarea lozoyensis (strain ATCC 74030 / MF5533) TaxID=1104152 RepID=H0ENA4_GLAL7|nr:hypothetical protein M7I_4107 [Glarea lozoyensis 74030]